MSQKYYAIVTNLGAAKIANAAALGTKLNITQMAVGDGGGTLPTPNASQTKLAGEKRRAAINTLSVDPANVSQVIAEQVIPETAGGFWIREMGLFDADGTLIAVCNTPETYKPALQEGSGRTQTVRMILIVNSTDAITLKIDPSVVLATRQYVDEAELEVRQYADDQLVTAKKYSDAGLKSHTEATDPHSQYLKTASALKEIADAGLVSDVLKNLSLDKFIALAQGALPLKGGTLTGDLNLDYDNPFTGIHLKNKRTASGSGTGIDFSFGGAIMASIICGITGSGANYFDFALSPSGSIADRRVNALTFNAEQRRLFLQNGWELSGYTKGSDFSQVMNDSGWVRFPNGTIIQWFWGNTDGNGWGTVNWPLGWPVRCHGCVSVNIAGDAPASAVAGVKRLSDRDFQVTLRESTGATVSKPFFCIGIGV